MEETAGMKSVAGDESAAGRCAVPGLLSVLSHVAVTAAGRAMSEASGRRRSAA